MREMETRQEEEKMVVKIFKALSVFIVTGVLLTATVSAEVVDRIVAVVNDEIITMSELNNTFESYRKKIEESYKNQDLVKIMAEARLVMLNKLIDQSLIEQETKKSGLTIKDDEVMDTIQNFLKQRKIRMEDLLNSLVKEGSTFEEYKKDVRNQLIRMKVVRRQIQSKIAVSEEEIGDYYLKHREDYEGKEAVKIKQILILLPKNVAATTKAKIKGEMDMIYTRLKNGEPFDLLAARYSQGPAASAGGDLGFVEKGMIFPAVENAAFSLKVDEMSGVIESSIGFHIIMVIDKRGAGIKPIESVRIEIREKLEGEKMEKKYNEWISDLRNKSHIEIKL
jgi:parvulin-like peptidyl-prolyl isomerase